MRHSVDSAVRAALVEAIPPPWGAYRRHLLVRAWIKLCRCLPPASSYRRLGIWLRSPLKRLVRGPTDTQLWGLRLRLHPVDNLSESRWLFLPQFTDYAERMLLTQRLTPGSVFLDIGANAGLYSFWVWSRCGNSVRVEAFEPDPELCRRFAFNVATNGADSIHINQMALGDTCGTAHLSFGIRNRGTNQIVDDGNAVASITVPLTTLHEFVMSHNLNRIDALKIDVEGREEQILGHFFANTPQHLYPHLLICETLGGMPTDNGLALMLRTAGYTTLLRGRMNTVFERSN
ncbi:MAG: FkbM family methyltransferase [Lentisphaerae bacterium]|nr:FkbM family methyltransferase [Lentisphaerota bacterium]